MRAVSVIVSMLLAGSAYAQGSAVVITPNQRDLSVPTYVNATVVRVDARRHTITFRSDSGEVSLTVEGDAVRNLGRLRAGDQVILGYRTDDRSGRAVRIVTAIHAGEGVPNTGTVSTAAATPAPAAPSGFSTVTGRVVSIDPAAGTVVLADADGRTETLALQQGATLGMLGGVLPGDQVDVAFTPGGTTFASGGVVTTAPGVFGTVNSLQAANAPTFVTGRVATVDSTTGALTLRTPFGDQIFTIPSSGLDPNTLQVGQDVRLDLNGNSFTTATPLARRGTTTVGSARPVPGSGNRTTPTVSAPGATTSVTRVTPGTNPGPPSIPGTGTPTSGAVSGANTGRITTVGAAASTGTVSTPSSAAVPRGTFGTPTVAGAATRTPGVTSVGGRGAESAPSQFRATPGGPGTVSTIGATPVGTVGVTGVGTTGVVGGSVVPGGTIIPGTTVLPGGTIAGGAVIPGGAGVPGVAGSIPGAGAANVAGGVVPTRNVSAPSVGGGSSATPLGTLANSSTPLAGIGTSGFAAGSADIGLAGQGTVSLPGSPFAAVIPSLPSVVGQLNVVPPPTAAPTLPEQLPVGAAREWATRDYDNGVRTMTIKANEIDAHWFRYRDGCLRRSSTTAEIDSSLYAPNRDRQWFLLFDGDVGTPVDDNCRQLMIEMTRMANDWRDTMTRMEDTARKNDVLPGAMREIRQRYRVEF